LFGFRRKLPAFVTRQQEKKRTHKKTLSVVKYYVTKVTPMSEAMFVESKAKLDELNRKDNERVELEAARNQVESYCYLIKNKLIDDEEKIAVVSTEEQREEISKLAADTTEWLDFDAYDADLETMQSKYKALSEPAEKIWFRMKELTQRPEAIAALNEKLGKVEELLKKWETSMPQVTEDERADVQTKVDEIKKWIQDKLEEQDTKAPHEEPAFSSADVPLQTKGLEKIIAKLSKKPKPKPEKKKEEDKPENETATDGADGEEESKPDEPQEASKESEDDDKKESEEAKDEATEGNDEL
jgi:hypoxia up-regulated 1